MINLLRILAAINNIYKKTTSLRFVTANARSLAPKIRSLITCFDELDLHFSLINESWLKDGEKLEEDAQDLELGQNLKIFHRNRTLRRGKTAGGGVAILYDKSRIAMSERKYNWGKTEAIMAVGKIAGISRKIVIISMYIPPQTRANKVLESLTLVRNAIGSVKNEMDDPLL